MRLDFLFRRHAGDDQAILAVRHAFYLQARERHPAPLVRRHAKLGARRLRGAQSRTRLRHKGSAC